MDPRDAQAADHARDAVAAMGRASAALEEARLALTRAERAARPGQVQTALQAQRVRLERAAREVGAVAAMAAALSDPSAP